MFEIFKINLCSYITIINIYYKNNLSFNQLKTKTKILNIIQIIQKAR
jgi:hypothetical protein